MKKVLVVLMAVMLFATMFVGCNKSVESPEAAEAQSEVTAEEESVEDAQSEGLSLADLGITYLQSDDITIMEGATTAYGMETASGEDLAAVFTPEILQEVKDGDFTAVYCGHEDFTLWAQSLIESLDSTLDKLGVELLTSTGSNWSIDDQISKIESCIEMNPSLMVIYIMDADAYANVLKKASDKGIYLIGLNGMPSNTDEYDTYLGTIIPDTYMLGYYSMDMLCDKVQDGQIGASTIIYYGEDSNSRFQGAMDAAANYDKIEVIQGADIAMTVESATEIGESMIMAYPEMKGYWATWDALAVGAGSGMASLGKNVYVSGPDISDTSSVRSMLTDGMFVGTAAISPNDLGTLVALMGALGFAGEESPELVLSPVVMFNVDNVKEAWQYSFGQELDAELKELID